MKKTLALILALCMALAAVSAFAEDVTGTWYLVMFSLSAGTIDLNADGTFVMAVSASGDEQKYEGEWTAEGEKLALTVDGETLYLVSDGSSLNFSTDNIPADASESGLDLGALFSLISISREPGKLTLDEFTAYMNDRTLPEGVSEEDMAAVFAGYLSAMASMAGSGSTAEPAAEPTAEPAAETEEEPALTVLEENFYVRESYSGQEAVWVGKVQNGTEKTLYLNNGALTLTDADNEEAGQAKYLYSAGSRYLDPGEITFVTLIADVAEGKTVAAHTYTLESREIVSWDTPDTALEVSAELDVDYEYSNYAFATITNSSDTPQKGIRVALLLKDADGNLLDVVTGDLGRNILGANSTFILCSYISNNLIKYCTANEITLGAVEAIGWIEAR